ncbi:MAG: DUF1320 domain-containing protein [Candidatus Paceibacterota bacterium]|jgi:phage gp36-like protein
MAYSTHDDIKRLISYDTLLQLCDDDNVGDIVVDPPNTAYANVLQAIVQADNTIDSYIATKHTLPLAITPGCVKDCSANLALCNLYDRRREMDVPEGVERRRKQFTQWLKDVQMGKATIMELQSEQPASYIVNKTSSDQIFTDDLLSSF